MWPDGHILTPYLGGQSGDSLVCLTPDILNLALEFSAVVF